MSAEAPMANAIDDVKGVSDADADREMMDNSEMYVQGRFAQMILQDVGKSSTAYYDAAQLRAAFRAGYDYANRRASPARQHTGWSDEAVEAAAKAILKLSRPNGGGNWRDLVPAARAALSAASSIAPATGFEVLSDEDISDITTGAREAYEIATGQTIDNFVALKSAIEAAMVSAGIKVQS